MDAVRDRRLAAEQRKRSAAQLAAYQRAQIICPHCQVRGFVTMVQAMRKKGISGGKAAAATVTRGKSVWVTGLSQKTMVTTARCANCGVIWTV